MSIGLIALGAVIAGALLEGVALHFLLPMLKETGAVRQNYQGIDIPVSAGISFPLVTISVFAIYVPFSFFKTSYYPFLLGIMALCFLGFIDDMLGQRDALGFKGHFGALFKGSLTTGGLKALGGGVIAFFLALLQPTGWVDLLLNTMLMALFTNMLNLLDLRPGRAIKGYLFFLIIIVALAGARVDWLIIAPLLGAVIIYFVIDLKARAMMGDAGSNVLGLALGYISVISLNLPCRAGVLLFLILLHIYTEKYSLTRTIEKYSFLRAVDKLGRGESGG
ncbi:MAG: hypothetical protein PHC92_09670 [Syntrophomonadaceae bacterium]|nr:hypothetical protein [Syntrophomonadaceae bacterium]MDD3024819.1 hypothetical protein [Syntrophomonadaceae bacterium]